MPLTFAKAPLVEIIAEIRWQIPSQIQIGPLGVNISNSSHDQLYSKFSDLAARNGYPRSERLLPHGFPIEMGQATWRFRPIEGGTLWQLGAGLFTANAVPPYKTWEEFSPQLKTGIELMLQARREVGEEIAPASIVSLRYIDAFGAQLTQGLSSVDFLCEKFGFELKLPAPLTKSMDKQVAIQLTTDFQFQLINGMQLGMNIAPGMYQNEQVLMMTTGVVKNTPTEMNTEALLGIFESAHSVIHDAFLEMSKPLHEKMEPQGTAS